MNKDVLKKHVESVLDLLESNVDTYESYVHVLLNVRTNLNHVYPRKKSEEPMAFNVEQISHVQDRDVPKVFAIIQYLHENDITFKEAREILCEVENELECARYV